MKNWLIALTVCSVLAQPAMAQHSGHDHAESKTPARVSKLDEAFARYDVNKDGFVTRDEIPEGHALHEHFDMSDKNRDGKLSKKEFGIALKMI